jgi:hypothetical protein
MRQKHWNLPEGLAVGRDSHSLTDVVAEVRGEVVIEAEEL